jgi:ABC-type transport system substrate-binding protein
MQSKNSRFLRVASALLTACALMHPIPGMADAKNQILDIGLGHEPFTLDPAKGVAGTDYPYLYTLYERLLNLDPQTLEPRPGLAESWKFSPDMRSLELQLRENLKFHDGTVLDAEAVKASLLHFRDEGRSQDLAVVRGIRVTSARSLVLELDRPFSPITSILADRAGMIISPTAQKRLGKEFDLKPVGAGPFMVKSWTPGNRMELVRFPGYWNTDRIKLEGIVFRFILNPPSLVSAMLTGQIDYAFGLDPKNMPVLKARPGIRVAAEPSLGFTQIGVHLGYAPMDNVLVRRALSMSVDRTVLRDAVIGQGMGDGATAVPVPVTSEAKATPAYQEAIRYNPEKAKELLAQAGFPDGLTLHVCASNSLAAGSDITDIEREQMRAAGITLNVTMMTSSACLQAYNLRKEFPLWQGRFTGRPHPYMTYQQYFGSSGQYNKTKHAFPGVDEILDQIAATEDTEVQRSLFAKLDALWIEQFPVIPLFFLPNFSAYSDKIAGEIPNAQGKPDPTSIYFVK